jgi:CRISPR-associated endoribonuclease Cas6
MRFKLTLKVNREVFGDILPLSYQYELSAAIYKILSKADAEYATWLHNNGFELNPQKKFKLFTFSRLTHSSTVDVLARQEGTGKIYSDTVDWQITFLPERSTKTFIEGLFMNQTFEVGGDRRTTVQFTIVSVEAMPEPEYSEDMEFDTISPMCIKLKDEDNRTHYLSPSDVRAPYLIFNGLIDRYKTFYHEQPPFSASDCTLEVTREPKSALITVKAGTPNQTRVRGYMCSFKVKAPVEIMKLIYASGVGSMNAIGFGCVEIKPPAN